MFKVKRVGYVWSAVLVAGMAGASSAAAAATIDPAVLARVAANPNQAAPVLVELATTVQRDSTLSIDERRAQHARISASGRRVIELARTRNRHSAPADRVLQALPFAGTSVDAQGLAALRASSDVKAVYLAEVKHAALAQSTALINAQAAWSANFKGGSGQTVAVLDTGIDTRHPWFAGRIVDGACFTRNIPNAANPGSFDLQASCPGATPGTLAPGPKYGAAAAQSPTSATVGTYTFDIDAWRVAFSHGTHVAGIAAGKNPSGGGGVAPDANIIAVNAASFGVGLNWVNAPGIPFIFPVDGFDDRDIVAGLDWILSKRTSYKIAAVNMSLGGQARYRGACDSQVTGGNIAIRNSINALVANGISVVAAAGNDGDKTGMSAPGCLSAVTSVGATDKTTGAVASYSNTGSSVDVLAPGTSIESANLGSTGTTAKSGTSMAAPHVAGAIADYKQKFPNATPAQVEADLKATGIKVGDGSGNSIPRIRMDGVLGLPTGVEQPLRRPSGASEEALLKADFNGDGKSDAVALYNNGNTTSELKLWMGGANGLGSVVQGWRSGAGGFGWENSKLAVGDFNGDGKSDLASVYKNNATTVTIWVWPGTASGLGSPYPAVTGDKNQGFSWDNAKLVSGDFNGDGRTDIGSLYKNNQTASTIWVWYGSANGLSSGYQLGAGSTVSGGFEWDRSKLVSGDFTGDGKADIAALYNNDNARSTIWMWRSTGSGFAAPTPIVNGTQNGVLDWQWAKLVPGDFNGDGRADLAALYNHGSNGSEVLIWPGGGATGLGAPNRRAYYSGAGNFSWENSKVLAGDFNGDGRSDVGVLYDYYGSANAAIFTFNGQSTTSVSPFTRNWFSGIDQFEWLNTKAL